MKKLLSIVMIIPLLFGCSNSLTREKAEKLIMKKYNLPFDETRAINISLQTSDEFKSLSSDTHNTPSKQGEMINLEKEGLITYTIERISSYTQKEWYDPNSGRYGEWMEPQGNMYGESFIKAMFNKGYKISYIIKDTYQHTGKLTEEGRKYLVSENIFKVARKEFGEITGIVERKELNISEVQYTERIKDITPFGKVLGLYEETINKTATFTKYDDGWRINQ
jgi:hypothetical protein